MKKVTLKSIFLQNYRCFSGEREFHADFGEKNRVSGKNGSGKSTVMNAVMEVLTGKNADGTQPDNVRPMVDGQELKGVDVVRSLVLDINGAETEIKKITKQKKEKVDGVSQYVPGSNVNSYEVDGISFTQKRFSEFIEENICKSDMMTACCNPNTFLSLKSTTDQRAFLENMAGFDLQEYIKSLGTEFLEIEEITKGHPIEQVQKTLNKQLTEQRKKTEQAETTWKYEKSREPEKGESVITELQESIDEYSKKISELDEQEKILDESVKAYDEKSAELLELKNKVNLIYIEENKGVSEKRQSLKSEISDLQIQRREKANNLQMIEMDLKHANMGIERYSAEVKKAQKDWKTYSEREYPEENLERIKAEQFDESSLICPTCRQNLPEEQAEKIRSDFEANKTKRIMKEEDVKTAFYEAKDKKLTEITENGNKAAADLEEAKKAKEEAEQKIVETKKSISDLDLKITEKERKLSELPESVDLSNNSEYQKISTEISMTEEVLKQMSNGSERRAAIRAKRNEHIRESAKLAAEINRIQSDRKKHEEQVEKLYADYRESSQLEADIQRKKDILKNFSIKKNERIAEMINPYFSEIQFNFLSYTQNNDPIEVCEILRNGIEYKNLNYSDQLLCRVDLLRGFQNMQGVKLPIFVDNAESINSERLPEIEQQMIVLEVSDGDLRVEEVA